jgi:hypothetical protein
VRATIGVVMGISVLGCIGASARQPALVTDLKVKVYLAWEAYPPALYDVRAKFWASRLLADAGIALEWHDGAPDSGVGPEVVGITVVAKAPPDYDLPPKRNALASALPYATGPVRIQVYYDRLMDYVAAFGVRAPMVVGHVFAHEIGHVLEGIARHSEKGLMRARWSADDLWRITRYGLPFAAEDRFLMRSRLERAEGSVR